MKREEAYQILELSPNASEEEVKKKYKELSRKMHPDINKDPGAEDKFKKINESYTRIKNQDFEQEIPQGFSEHGFGFSGINLGDLFANISGFGIPNQSKKRRHASHIQVPINLSFKDSIFGCKKEISFQREIMCQDCGGDGEKPDPNSCKACNGIGRTVINRGNTIITSTCNKCFGKNNKLSCSNCNSKGTLSSSITISVNVPGGVVTGNILRLSGIGNFIARDNFGEEVYTDVHVYIRTEIDDDFFIKDENIIYNLEISLLESLEGCTKSVKTLDGSQDIDIPKLSKHKDEIRLPQLGINRKGDQIVTLNIDYPKNIEKLITALKE